MKKIIVYGLVVLLWVNCYSQSVFRIIKPAKVRFRKPTIELRIQRVTIVETSRIESAIKATEFQSRMRYQQEIFRESMTIAGNNKSVAATVLLSSLTFI